MGDSGKCVSGRTYVVTGATSGIGEAIASGLAGQGARVLGVARSPERADAALARIRGLVPNARVEMLVADLSVLIEVAGLAEQVTARVERLDALILNAAVARPRRELTADDGFEVDFATNHLSGFLLTQRLRGLLTASAPARIVTVSSSAHRHVRHVDLDALVTGRDFHPRHTYAATKLLTLWFTTELARRLAGTGTTANSADPGFVRTGLSRDAPGGFGLFLKAVRPFQRSPAKGAATPLYLATSPAVADTSGGYFADCRPAKTSDLAQDSAAAQQLWALSSQLVSRRPAGRRRPDRSTSTVRTGKEKS